MKRTIVPLLAALLLSPGLLSAQTNRAPTAAAPPKPEVKPPPEPLGAEPHRFELNFPGGPPRALVEWIDASLPTPLNVIIQEQDKNVWIPALRMNAVTVPELFSALSQANSKQVTQVTGPYFGGINGQASSQYQIATESYGFRTSDNPPTDHSIWYFYHIVPPKLPDAEPEQVCRYFQLGPYLETYKVEDITTAIETGWWMLSGHDGPVPRPGTGVLNPRGQSGPIFPRLSFHKDTKLLIAVGEPEKLKLIDSVLEQLRPTLKGVKNRPVAEPDAPAPAKSGEPDKP